MRKLARKLVVGDSPEVNVGTNNDGFKETLVLRHSHPDLQPALDKLLSGTVSDAVTAQVLTETDTAETLVSNRAARGEDPDVSDSDVEMSDDEVTVFLITFLKIYLTSFPCQSGTI